MFQVSYARFWNEVKSTIYLGRSWDYDRLRLGLSFQNSEMFAVLVFLFADKESETSNFHVYFIDGYMIPEFQFVSHGNWAKYYF